MFNINALQHIWRSALLLCLLPFLLLGLYTHPSIHDDYLNANSILETGRLGFIKKDYFTWTGRYTELFLKSILSPLTYKNALLMEKLLSISVILFVILALYIPCSIIFGKYDGSKISLLLMVVFISGLTNISSVFYWSGGATAYTAGIIFSGLFIGFLYNLKNRRRKRDLFLSCLFVFLATGCYEVIMMATLWITLSNLVYSKITKKGFADSIILFIVNFASALFLILSPGNSVRAAGVSSGASVLSVTGLFTSALKSLFFATGAAVSWLDSLQLLLGTLVLLHLINRKENFNVFSIRISPLLVLLWGIVGVSISIFPSVLAYQTVWEHTWQCVYFFFLLGWVLLANSLFAFLDGKYNINPIFMDIYIILWCRLGFIFLVFLSSGSNVNIAYLDLLKAPEYQRRALRRDVSMQQAAKSKQVAELQPLFLLQERYKIPKTLYTLEYDEADAHAFAAYNGVQNIIFNQCYLLK